MKASTWRLCYHGDALMAKNFMSSTAPVLLLPVVVGTAPASLVVLEGSYGGRDSSRRSPSADPRAALTQIHHTEALVATEMVIGI